MTEFFRSEYHRLLGSKFLYPIRILLRCFGVMLVSQWLYSAAVSFYHSGELNVVWRADWIFEIAPLLWLLYVFSVILVGKKTSSTNVDLSDIR